MTRFSIFSAIAFLVASAIQATDFELATMTVPVASIVEANLLKGDHYVIAESVTVENYIARNPENQDHAQSTL